MGLDTGLDCHRGDTVLRLVAAEEEAGLDGETADNVVAVQAVNGDNLVAAGMSLDDAQGRAAQSQRPAEEDGKFPVGLAVCRRRGDFNLKNAPGETGYLGTAGVGSDFQPYFAMTGSSQDSLLLLTGIMRGKAG